MGRILATSKTGMLIYGNIKLYIYIFNKQAAPTAFPFYISSYPWT